MEFNSTVLMATSLILFFAPALIREQINMEDLLKIDPAFAFNYAISLFSFTSPSKLDWKFLQFLDWEICSMRNQ